MCDQVDIARLQEQVRGLQKELDLKSSAHNTLHSADSRALDLARLAVDTKLDSMNEFRKQLTEERVNLVGRVELDLRASVIGKRLDDLEKYRATMDGRILGITGLFGLIVVVAGLAIRFL